jgi:hypothetical protein
MRTTSSEHETRCSASSTNCPSRKGTPTMTAEVAADVLPFTSKPVPAWVVITPDLANRWLERNDDNRAIARADVERYKRDMLGGRWHLDGSPIRLGPDGALLDGQHRLTAVAESGVSIPMLIIRGVDPAARAAMDTGRKRTASDALVMAGHTHAALLSATARLHLEAVADRVGVTGPTRLEVSHDEIIAALDAEPDLVTAVEFVHPFARRTDCPPTVVAYTYFVLRRIDPKGAAEFWLGVAEKVGLRDGDPVLALSNRLAESRRRREYLDRRMLLSMIYRAWNARRSGHTMRVVRTFAPGGGPVPIPEPR